ncbi:response regulator [Metabacillus halosaccharovorans]|uniref:response regulator n=1 Tax=Metabacillus halosaccharovorans TaxID=930124 RepID=UPI001C1F8509|nr:response regulator [Metabacillus halosaccharovorans]MBU7595268.1 response regulator [Metabacillus halosaccharovorans]MCM3439856.1 response regulator [Metabacillus halosaccharovorans]
MIKVLIVEDDFRIAQVQEGFLQKIPDVQVVGKALNAEDTINSLKKQKVDLILLDIYLPDRLGTDLLPHIRENYPEIDIIMITAATEKAMLETSIRQGVFHYLLKPVTMEKFIETIESYKKRKKLLHNREEVDQSIIDQYFGTSVNQLSFNQKDLPSGVDRLTLQKVKEVLHTLNSGISIEEMGEKMGASRTTARRYLEYLVSINICIAKHEYGIVGRPERKYYLKK